MVTAVCQSRFVAGERQVGTPARAEPMPSAQLELRLQVPAEGRSRTGFRINAVVFGSAWPSSLRGPLVLDADASTIGPMGPSYFEAIGLGRKSSQLKLHVESSREDRDRTPVHVECRMKKELVIACQNHAIAKRVGVVSLDNLLAAVGKRAVADQEAKAA